MPKSHCPNCGADVTLGRALDTNGFQFVVPLEKATDSASDSARYRITGYDGEIPLIERVALTAVGGFFPDHRDDCPAHRAGRKR